MVKKNTPKERDVDVVTKTTGSRTTKRRTLDAVPTLKYCLPNNFMKFKEVLSKKVLQEYSILKKLIKKGENRGTWRAQQIRIQYPRWIQQGNLPKGNEAIPKWESGYEKRQAKTVRTHTQVPKWLESGSSTKARRMDRDWRVCRSRIHMELSRRET